MPQRGDPVLIAHAAGSLAVQAGGRYPDQGYLFCSETGWIGSAPDRHISRDGGRYISGQSAWRPSLSNEAVLRGAIWLTGEMPDKGAVDRLERTVASAVAYSDSNGLRSRSTANAAIAALARIGTPAARKALGRIRRSVPDKAIAGSVAKAVAELARKLGVGPANVEEMAVPDYGFG